MKKIILSIVMLLISFSVFAERIEYGRFGSWDAYYLYKDNGDVACAARGYFTGGYKVIFNIGVPVSDGVMYAHINVEHPSWSMQPYESAKVSIRILDQNGKQIHSETGNIYNNSRFVISQIPITVNPKVYGYVMKGYTLIMVGASQTLKFDIGDPNVNTALAKMAECTAKNLLDEDKPESTNPFQ